VIFKKPVNPTMLKKVLLQQCRGQAADAQADRSAADTSSSYPEKKIA
jgi:hypothetical protein